MKAKLILASFVALTALAPLIASAGSQCGPFHIVISPLKEGQTRINGVKPARQKVTFLKQKGDYENVQIHWIVAATKFQGNYGMDYISKEGKPILNVEVIRTSQNQIRISGSYDCEKVK